LGYLGPFAMGVLDSSFLFLPFGNDILLVALVASHPKAFPIYVVSAVCGGLIGVVLLDFVARRIGEAGVQKVAGQRRFEYLRKKIGQHGAIAVLVACIAPPPFPFTMIIAINSALGLTRSRLLWSVVAGRSVRFAVLGYLAIRYGHAILRLINSNGFKGVMIGISVLCIAASAVSISNWVRKARVEPVKAAA
jgi:membrane protein YqaA with SNARE-associated domain